MPRRRLVRASLLLLAVLSLSACGPPVVTLAHRQPLPPSLWECPPQPTLPADDSDDATFFSWVVDTMAAGQNCRSSLAIARTAVEGGS